MGSRLKALRSWYAACADRAWYSPASNAYLGVGLVALVGGPALAWAAFSRGALAIGVVAVLFAGAGAVGTILGLRNTKEQSRIRDAGTECWATVVGVVATPTRYVTTYTLTYRYEDRNGTAHVATVVTGSRTAADRWQPGDAARVRYDPSRPERSAWLGRIDRGERRD